MQSIKVQDFDIPMCPQAHSFEIEEDSTAYSTYQKGGLATQVKETKHLSFRTLKEALRVPGDFMISDFSKLDRPGHLHVGFQALDAFQVSSTVFLPKR